ncbi:MAG TPA: UDP-glucose 4-epimerase GalE [Bacteroidales bacterium]|nr:UDP-glucose 4-epimerase GalE [Bacteroidales bacterium]HRZ77437.1 UDP-glucose 4-epimerase GalE [Bacteroidales bacterium]
MKMRVGVTGGTGYIGSHTVVELMSAGHEVVIVDNFSNSEPGVLDALEQITGRRPVFVKADLACPDQAREFFSAAGPLDAIIHFAAFLSVEESVRVPLHYFRNNLFSLVHVLQGMQSHSIPHMVFSSSCTVYGQPDTLPISEDAPLQPAWSPYGQTKQMSEDILRSCTASGGVRAIALRYFNPIGAHPSALIGELPYGLPHHLVPFIVQTASGQRDYLRIFGYDYNTLDGTPVRDYIHVTDLARAHVQALERMAGGQGREWEVYNLGVGHGFSVLDMVKAFEEATGLKVPYQLFPRRAGDVEKVWADNRRAREVLGWIPEYGLHDMMRTAWDWEQHLRGSGWYERNKR